MIEQTIREKLPEGFQRAEYLREHGMVDIVVTRAEMKPTLVKVLSILTHQKIECAMVKSEPAKTRNKPLVSCRHCLQPAPARRPKLLQEQGHA